jgi:PAS domain S-box-containing protein
VHRFFFLFLIAFSTIILTAALVWVWNIRLRQRVASCTKALTESEKTLRTILTTSPLGVGLTDGRTLGWHNPSMCRMLGYDAGELEGRDLKELYRDRHDLDATSQMIQRTLQQNNHEAVETQWVRKDGSVFDCRLHYAPLRTRGNQQIGITLAEDITEHKRYQNALIASEALFRDLAEKLPFPLAIGTADHKTEYINPKFTEVFGYTLEEVPTRRPGGKNSFPILHIATPYQVKSTTGSTITTI